jgi:hypothetical protein
MAVKQTPRGEKPAEEVKKILNEQEEHELSEGQALYEMEKSNPGWQIIKKWLTDAAYHSWVDPRQTKDEEEWKWRELNAFHASNNAKEILEEIAKAVSRAEYLDKVKNGEIQRNKMRIV